MVTGDLWFLFSLSLFIYLFFVSYIPQNPFFFKMLCSASQLPCENFWATPQSNGLKRQG